MSRAFGYGALNAKVNTLTSLILTSGTPVPDLETVLTAGNAAQTPLVINDPSSTILTTVNYDTVIVSDPGGDTAVHQLDGFVASNGVDFGQLLKNKVIFSTTGHVSEVESTATSLEITSSDININGQVSFDTPPHSVDAINGNDLCTKGYVDSLTGQYSGGYNLFLNYSVVDGLYRSLGQSIVVAAPPPVPTTTDGSNQLVAQFVTSALGITSIPSGIWNVLLYSEVSAPAGIVNYYFELHTLTGATETLVTTSGFSADVNSTTVPTGFPINATISAPVTVALTDKIVLKIFVHKDGTPVNVNTYFQDEYYSFSQSTLNAGTTLLSSNNTWTGTNKFTLGITAPSLDRETAAALNIGTTTASGVNIGRAGITTFVAGTFQTVGIDRATAGAFNIGATNATSINLNNKAVSGLTYGVNQYVTLSANTSLPISGQIGFTSSTPSYTASGTFASAGTNKSLCAGVALSCGVYLCTFNTVVAVSGAAVFTYIYFSINNAAGTQQLAYQIGGTASAMAALNLNIPISGVIVVPSAGDTYTPIGSIPSTGGTYTTSSSAFKYTFTRIA